jgi:outer membrane protein assembly factor BamB
MRRLPHAPLALFSFALLAGCIVAPPPPPPAPHPRHPPADDSAHATAAHHPPHADQQDALELAADPAHAAADPPPPPAAGPLSEWATFHGDAARTGASGAPAIARPTVTWRARVGIQGWLNGPLVVGGVVVVPSSGTAHNRRDRADGVYALDLRTGRRLWHARFDLDANGVAAAGDRVFATSDDGWIRALDLRTGRILWRQRGEGKVYSHPLVVGDLVVVGDAGGWLRALAVDDGRPLWSVRLAGPVRGGASADDRLIFAASQGGEVVALTLGGDEVWRRRVLRPPFGGRGPGEPIEVYSPPVLAHGLLVLPFARDTTYDAPALIALDQETGAERWHASAGSFGRSWGNVRSTPALVAGTLVYSEPYSGDAVGIDARTGRAAWRETVGPCYFPQWASPAAAADLVYVPRFDGSVYALRPGTGERVWQIYLGGSRPAGRSSGCEWEVQAGHSIYSPAAVAPDGTLLVGTAEGFLYAITDDPPR